MTEIIHCISDQNSNPDFRISTEAELIMPSHNPETPADNDLLVEAINTATTDLGVGDYDPHYSKWQFPNGTQISVRSDGTGRLVIHTPPSESGVVDAMREFSLHEVVAAIGAAYPGNPSRVFKKSGIEPYGEDPNSFGYLRSFQVPLGLAIELSNKKSPWLAVLGNWAAARQLIAGGGILGSTYRLSAKESGIGRLVGDKTPNHGKKPLISVRGIDDRRAHKASFWFVAADPTMNPELTAQINELDMMVVRAIDHFRNKNIEPERLMPLPNDPIENMRIVSADLSFTQPIATDPITGRTWTAADYLKEFTSWALFEIHGFKPTAQQLFAAEEGAHIARECSKVDLGEGGMNRIKELTHWGAKYACLAEGFPTKNGKITHLPVSNRYPPVFRREIDFDAIGGRGQTYWQERLKTPAFSANALKTYLRTGAVK